MHTPFHMAVYTLNPIMVCGEAWESAFDDYIEVNEEFKAIIANTFTVDEGKILW